MNWRATLVLFLAISAMTPVVSSAQGDGHGRVLVLYASTGGGKSAAKAIAEQVHDLNPAVETVLMDARDFEKPDDVARMIRTFDFLTQKTPWFYNLMYTVNLHLGGRTDWLGQFYRDRLFKGKVNPKLVEYINELKPSAIVSAFDHVTGGLLAARAEGKIPMQLPIAQVLTDNVDSAFYLPLINAAEMTFVPNTYIRQSYLDMGAPENKVVASGIPVHPLASTDLTPSERAQVFADLGFDPSQPLVLLVSGSAGVGNFDEMLTSIDRGSDIENPPQVVLVTARNSKQFERVSAIIAGGKLRVRAKVLQSVPQDQLLSLMKAAQVIVTKPGGLSTSEIATIGVPLVLIDLYGGQEGYNERLFTSHFMALSAIDFVHVGELVNKLIASPELRDRMRINQRTMMAAREPEGLSNWILDQVAAAEGPVAPASSASCEGALNGDVGRIEK